MNKNPVHKNKDDKWYFWDETWAFEQGPFETKHEANVACSKNYAELIGEDK